MQSTVICTKTNRETKKRESSLVVRIIVWRMKFPQHFFTYVIHLFLPDPMFAEYDFSGWELPADMGRRGVIAVPSQRLMELVMIACII